MGRVAEVGGPDSLSPQPTFLTKESSTSDGPMISLAQGTRAGPFVLAGAG